MKRTFSLGLEVLFALIYGRLDQVSLLKSVKIKFTHESAFMTTSVYVQC